MDKKKLKGYQFKVKLDPEVFHTKGFYSSGEIRFTIEHVLVDPLWDRIRRFFGIHVYSKTRAVILIEDTTWELMKKTSLPLYKMEDFKQKHILEGNIAKWEIPQMNDNAKGDN